MQYGDRLILRGFCVDLVKGEILIRQFIVDPLSQKASKESTGCLHRPPV